MLQKSYNTFRVFSSLTLFLSYSIRLQLRVNIICIIIHYLNSIVTSFYDKMCCIVMYIVSGHKMSYVGK